MSLKEIIAKVDKHKEKLPKGVALKPVARGNEWLCEAQFQSEDLIVDEETGEMVPRFRCSSTHRDVDTAVATVLQTIKSNS